MTEISPSAWGKNFEKGPVFDKKTLPYISKSRQASEVGIEKKALKTGVFDCFLTKTVLFQKFLPPTPGEILSQNGIFS